MHLNPESLSFELRVREALSGSHPEQLAAPIGRAASLSGVRRAPPARSCSRSRRRARAMSIWARGPQMQLDSSLVLAAYS